MTFIAIGLASICLSFSKKRGTLTRAYLGGPSSCYSGKQRAAANWFTLNPYTAEVGISASKWSNFRKGFPLMKDEVWSQWVDELEPIWKQKWMANDIYELIMMSKATVFIKHELLATVLLFWKTETNTVDFRVGPIIPTILDMAQVFGLRPSGKCVDITHDWSSPSRPTIKSSEAFQSITSLEYNSTTFKSYVTSFADFIPFAKKMFSSPSSIVDLAQEHMHFLLYWLNKHVFPNKSE